MSYDKIRKSINEIIAGKHSGKDLSADQIKNFINAFKSLLAPALKDSIFAHYKHAIEYLVREHEQTQRPILYTEGHIPSSKRAIAKYLRGGYVIATSKDLDVRERRIQLGHELGHILINNINNTIYKTENLSGFPDNKSREFMASLISLSMHITQSDFYKGETCKKYQYDETQLSELAEEIIGLARSVLK